MPALVLWLSAEGHRKPLPSPPLLSITSTSVHLSVVVVEERVAILHVAIFGFFLALVFRLSLLFVAPLVLHYVVAGKELDDHAQDEPGPEDVQNLQYEHQPVEEVEAEEGRVEGLGVHVRRVYDPEGEDYEAGDDENHGKQDEDEVAGFPPTCIVEHFGRLHQIVGGIMH